MCGSFDEDDLDVVPRPASSDAAVGSRNGCGEHGPYVQHAASWIFTASLSGLPATVAPIGFTDGGLPVGVEIVAAMWEDGTSIEFAALLSEVSGGFTPPPACAE